MNFFKKIADKFKEGLAKTRDVIAQKVDELIFRYKKIDDQFFDELEEILISSDVGVKTVMELIDYARKECRARRIEDASELKPLLSEKLIEIMKKDGADLTLKLNPDGLTVFLYIGVNGVGKTTTIGKMAHHFKQKNKKVKLS